MKVPDVPKNCFKPNFVIASANIFTAIPTAQIWALYLILATAIIMAITIPLRIAQTMANSQLPVIKLVSTATKAEVSMIPSVPMFKISACWVMVAHKAANKMGVADRIVA